MNISFYSYKGGVGRTQLCANIAAYLCYHKSKKILLWDWDMEAPGLHYYFDKSDEEIKAKGTLEIIEEYLVTMRKKETILQEDDLKVFNESNIVNLVNAKSRGRIDLIPAGNYVDKYSERLSKLDWSEIILKYDGIHYVDYLNRKLQEDFEYDYILIDTRTGINDYAGISNILLPGINVIVFVPNKQNFEGGKKIINKILNHSYVRQKSRFVLPILSRVDIDDNKNALEWIDSFVNEFSYLNNSKDNLESYSDVENEFRYYVDQTLIRHNKHTSFGENLFFSESINPYKKISQSFEECYMNLAYYIEEIQETGYISSFRKPIEQKESRRLFKYGEELLSKANIFFEEKDSVNAEIFLKKAINAFAEYSTVIPDSSEVQFKLGQCYFDLGKYQEAISYLEKAQEKGENSPDLKVLLGKCYILERKLDLADQFTNNLPDEFKIEIYIFKITSQLDDISHVDYTRLEKGIEYIANMGLNYQDAFHKLLEEL